MTKCPWCERYLRWYLKDEFYSGPDAPFTGDEAETERRRITKGSWANIAETQGEEKIVARLGIEAAFELGARIGIDMKSGETKIGGLGFYELAEIRDEVFGKQLEHYWIQSGACGMSFRTAICCEHGMDGSYFESIEWEMRRFRDLRDLTRKIAKRLEKESL